MGNDSVSSVSFSASAGSGLLYSYLNTIHKDNITTMELKDLFGVTEDQLKLKIKTFENYQISTIPNEAGALWSNIGIALFNFTTGSNYDYAYHWFLIAISEEFEEEEFDEEDNKMKPKKKHLYYLIEKTINGKNVDCSKVKETLIKNEEEQYEMEAYMRDRYSINGNITIKDILDFMKNKTSNEYDLLEDNCQDFVRLLIDKYC